MSGDVDEAVDRVRAYLAGEDAFYDDGDDGDDECLPEEVVDRAGGDGDPLLRSDLRTLTADRDAAGVEARVVGLALARDVLPDGRVDHRGHQSDQMVGDGTSTCLDCTSDDGDDPWITWTIPYDVDGRPMPKDWRDLPYAEVLTLCGMTPAPRPVAAEQTTPGTGGA